MPKRFTLADCDILRTVANLRANGLEPAQIADRLRADPTATMQTPVEAPQTAPAAALVTTTAPTSSEALAVFVAAADARLTDVAARVESLDRRLAANESNRRFLIGVLLAFVAGAALVGIIALLFIMLR